MVALSSVVVVLTTVWPGKVNASIAPEGGTAENGGGRLVHVVHAEGLRARLVLSADWRAAW